MTGWAERAMRLLQIVTTLVAVNLLILGGTLLGLVIGGLFPALVAGGAVLLGETGDAGVWRGFLRTCRAAFRRANLVGAPLLATAALLLVDAALLPQVPGALGAVLLVLTAVLAAATLVVGAVAVTLLVRYDDRPGAVLRQALLIAAGSPGTALAVVVTALGAGALGLVVPVLVPLAGVAGPLVLALRLVDRRLVRIDPRHPLRPQEARLQEEVILGA